MVPEQNTALITALGADHGLVVPFKTLTVAENPATESETRKARKPGKERGVWQEHGSYAASAGNDPVTGNRVREHGFATAEEAREWRAKKIAELASAANERRQQIRELAEHEAIASIRALDMLHAAGFIGSDFLTKAVEEWIRRHPQANPTTVREFYLVWISLKEKRDRRDRTLLSAKSAFKPFLKLYGDVSLPDVTIDQIESVVFDPAIPNPTTRRGRGIVIRNFFNEAAKRRLIGQNPTDNPCYALELPEKPETEPDPWTVDEYRKLLRFAWITEDQFHATAYVAIGGQAGLRTEELHRLRFNKDGIDIDRGIIRVPKDAAKKRRARNIVMDPGLQRLLIALRNRERVRLKHVRPLPRPTDAGSRVYSPKLLCKFKQALLVPVENGGAGFPVLDLGGQQHVSKNGKVTVTGPSAWRDNGLRAAFATFDFERGNDARSTAAKMGHTGSHSVFYDHYFTLAQKGEGAVFFAISDGILADII